MTISPLPTGHTSHTTIHIDRETPITPRRMDLMGQHVALNLTDNLALIGPPDYLLRLLRAGLKALSDGSTEAEVTERPTVRRPLESAGGPDAA